MAIIKTLKGMPAPRFGKHCYFSEGAVIVGDVEMGDDNSCIHTLNGKAPCILGDDVTIGHCVTLHGCEVQDGALVGMGATVLDHAVVGKGAIVAAGALVLSNTKIGDGELWGGVPAKFIKKVDPEQAQPLPSTAAAPVVVDANNNEVVLRDDVLKGLRPPLAV